SRKGDLFDLRLSDEERMLVEPVRKFAEAEIRAAAASADEACAVPRTLLEAAGELGIAAMAVPEALGGAGGERSVVGGIVVAEESAERIAKVFIVERGLAGVATSVEPSMGVRAAGLGRLELDGVRVPADAVLEAPFEEIVDLCRVGAAALAVGTAQAVLDYV